MTNTLTWTLLPNGIDPATGHARLSLVAHPAVEADSGRLSDTPLANWPAVVAGLPPLVVHVAEGSLSLPAQRRSSPDPQPWPELFAPNTKVGASPGPTDDGPFSSLVGAFDYRSANDEAERAYADALNGSPTALIGPDHPISRGLVDLAAAVAAPASARRGPLGGLAGVADYLDPPAARAARRAAARGEPAAAPVIPSPLSPIAPVEQADIHQVISLIMDHPALARRLGLVVDLLLPVTTGLRGDRTIRIATAGGPPLAGLFDQVRTPWSRTRLDPENNVFTMRTRPGPGTEIVNGMLDIEPTTDKYVVGTIDVAAAAQQFRALGDRLADANGGSAAGLPPRRDRGFTLAQSGRMAGPVRHALDSRIRFEGPENQLTGEPILYADDVTAGYRIDVSRDRGPFRSLMRRVATYRVGPSGKLPPMTVHDEGVVAPIVPVQQELAPGQYRLSVGEGITDWAGWSLAAPMPGLAVLAEKNGGPTVGVVPPQAAPGYPLIVEVTAERGSLERLRYGSQYSFRGRAVSLAGDSLSVEDADGRLTAGFVSAPTRFPRTEVVGPPVLVARHPLRPGEKLTRLVVTSDGDGQPLTPLTERHLAPPSGAVEQAERHGMFDAALGPATTPQTRATALAVARRESGSFTDPMVPGPAGTPVPADGITVVAPTGDPATLPLPAGQALPAGQYVVHASDRMRTPYLADPGAAGPTLITDGAGPGEVTTVRYGGRWPDVEPAKLRLRAGLTRDAPMDVAAGTSAGRPSLDVTIPPGTEFGLGLASAITEPVIDTMPASTPALRGLGMLGQIPMFSPRERIEVVHAVRRPIGTITRTDTFVEISHPTRVIWQSKVLCHGPSTAKVDLVARWTELVDPGFGPVTTIERSAVLGSQPVPRVMQTTPMTFRVEHDFGDTDRRDLSLDLVGSTRFKDCFPELPEGDPLTQRRVMLPPFVRPNTRRPEPPRIAGIVPIYAWNRSAGPTGCVATRRRAGVRVWLRRPWMTTGRGEQLGVVAWASTDAATAHGGGEFNAKVVSRWGVDVVEEKSARPGPAFTAASFPVGAAAAFVKLLPEAPGGTPPTTVVVPHDVTFDAERGEWFADINIDLPEPLPAFVRLALVRVQRESVFNNEASSIVTTDWIPLQPERTVTIKELSSTVLDLEVTVTGRHTRDRSFHVAVQQRAMGTPPGSSNPAPTDLTIEDGQLTSTLPVQQLPDKTFKAVGRITMPATVDPQRKARLTNGRVIIRELHTGASIADENPTFRVEWLEAIDVQAIGT